MQSRLRKDLRWITREGSTFCVTSGTGEQSFTPFLLASGHSAFASGQVATAPLFLGALMQNLAPWGLSIVGSVRNWSVAMVVFQSLCLLCLGLCSSLGSLPLWAIFSLISLYWAAGWSIGPAWNTWMDSLVPARLKARFFSQRSAYCEFIRWMSMLAAARLLYWAKDSSWLLACYSGLFVVAGLARLTGAYCMAQQGEPTPMPADYRVLGFAESYQKIRKNPKARPLWYILAAQISLNLAAPFLAAFLKQVRHLSDGDLMLCLAAVVLSKVWVYPRLGQLAQRLGPLSLFRSSGLGLALVSALWLLPIQHMGWYLLLQAFTGCCMAGHEMAATLVYLEAIPASDRTSILTRFTIFNTLAMLLGSSLGGGILWLLPSKGLAYLTMFALAGLSRLAALACLSARSTPVRPVKLLKQCHIYARLAIRLARRFRLRLDRIGVPV